MQLIILSLLIIIKILIIIFKKKINKIKLIVFDNKKLFIE